jgi:hypothetical protein
MEIAHTKQIAMEKQEIRAKLEKRIKNLVIEMVFMVMFSMGCIIGMVSGDPASAQSYFVVVGVALVVSLWAGWNVANAFLKLVKAMKEYNKLD